MEIIIFEECDGLLSCVELLKLFTMSRYRFSVLQHSLCVFLSHVNQLTLSLRHLLQNIQGICVCSFFLFQVPFSCGNIQEECVY
jgi:hypothetical protein